jgi:hypothetical protein
VKLIFSGSKFAMKNYKKSKKSSKSKAPANKQIELISYNEQDRKEFITGFHKRKVALNKLRVQKAIQNQKEDKRESRRQVRKKISQVLPEVLRIDQIMDVQRNVETTETHRISSGEVVVTVEEFEPDDLWALQE